MHMHYQVNLGLPYRGWERSMKILPDDWHV